MRAAGTSFLVAVGSCFQGGVLARSGHGGGGGLTCRSSPVLGTLRAGRGHTLTRLRPSYLPGSPASLLPACSRSRPPTCTTLGPSPPTSCCRPAVPSGHRCSSLLAKHVLSSASLVPAGPPGGAPRPPTPACQQCAARTPALPTRQRLTVGRPCPGPTFPLAPS